MFNTAHSVLPTQICAGQQHFLHDVPTPFCRATGALSAPALLHNSPIPQHSFPGPSKWPLVALGLWQLSVTGSPCAADGQHTHRAEFTAILTPELHHSPNQTLTLSPLCPSHSSVAFHGSSADPVNVTPVATRGR